mmetsp:Transcript_19682/g.29132  ORF Transcript_19682/g.29132 Transcript_19682/m.29132 type:complete len:249 (-) Transcript_19682:90-836(-)|eukprot:CAMPEP_0194045980 /NCGR_PEP_ID=MMETSP0009_2-20130614/19092_1 /TAXON_ID=210454 /ORGANISM="Grammatophora oceanica, Strain CCMP 410" /LENGTH=248 /DNA_ID=CAMNT_0038691055 /DNA_START=76 /DNA_END=822 /DNA_ORIENTATION=+
MKTSTPVLIISIASISSCGSSAAAFVSKPKRNTAVSTTCHMASPNLTLYGSQGSRSPLVNWAANELGLDLTMGSLHENPHPFGQIPCLKDGDTTIFESGAILLYLNSLLGKDDKNTGEILSWVSWANASLDPICFLETPEGKVYDTGLKKPNKRIDTLNEILGKTEFLVDNEFSVADVAIASYLLYVVQFFPGIDLTANGWDNIVRYMITCASRPAYAQAFGSDLQAYLVGSLGEMGKAKSNKLFGVF